MTKLLLSILIIISSSCFGQYKDSSEVSFWTPASWFSGDKKSLCDNLNNYSFNKDQINQLVNDINTSTVLGVFYKYDPKVHYGLIPTMKFYLRQNKINDFEQFFASAKNEIESIKSKVLNFKYVDSPKTIIVGQRKAFYASSSYNLNISTGEIANVRTKFVFISIGKQYLYATLIDNDKEDCSQLYEEVINKIKIK